MSGLSGTVEAIAAGADHTCGLITGGALECFGRNLFGQLGDGTTTNEYESSVFVESKNGTNLPSPLPTPLPTSLPLREATKLWVERLAPWTRVSGGARAVSTPAGTRDARVGLRETKPSARRTIGWPWDVFSSERGSISRGGGFGLRCPADHACGG